MTYRQIRHLCSISRPTDFLKKRYHFRNYKELCERVATTAAPVDIRESAKLAMMRKLFIPAGNTLLAGVRKIRPNCSILPKVTDENIGETITRASRLWRHHTGVGFDLSGTTDPVSVLSKLMKENRRIEFTDRCQRGNMAVVSASHPKVGEFISSKSNPLNADILYGVNISVAFNSDVEFESLLWEASNKKQGLLWTAAQSAWSSGCPGLVFLHRFNASKHEKELSKLLPNLPSISTTVPCGEQGMRENESCNLGVINLAHPDLRLPKHRDGINFDRLDETVDMATRFLDNVVDLLEIDDEEMLKQTKMLRRIGLGVTGFADLLESFNIPYASPEALHLASQLSSRITDQADKTSRKLAKEKGPYMEGATRRNITVTCCQPTGNVTRLLGTAGYAIEPMMNEAVEIHWRDHVAMQIAWQENVENAVSKTVNLPNSATVDDVLQVFKEAFLQKSIKGIAVYRDGSRNQQPMDLSTAYKNTNCATCA